MVADRKRSDTKPKRNLEQAVTELERALEAQARGFTSGLFLHLASRCCRSGVQPFDVVMEVRLSDLHEPQESFTMTLMRNDQDAVGELRITRRGGTPADQVKVDWLFSENGLGTFTLDENNRRWRFRPNPGAIGVVGYQAKWDADDGEGVTTEVRSGTLEIGQGLARFATMPVALEDIPDDEQQTTEAGDQGRDTSRDEPVATGAVEPPPADSTTDQQQA